MSIITSKKVKEGSPSLPLAINLNPYQQIRLMAVEDKKPAYRTWKSRMKSKGLIPTDEQYVLFGYEI
jgi:hypothetical protein